MEKQILLPANVRREMAEQFKASRNEMRRALNYTINSKRAKMLRAAALQRGGLIYTGITAPAGYIPTVATEFDHVNGFMNQSFGNRLLLRVSLTDSRATVCIDGKQVLSYENMTTGDWGNILYSLQQVYNQLNK